MAYVALQAQNFFPNCPKPAFQGVIQVRSEPSQGAVAVRFVTKETWPEIRRPFGSRGKLSPPSERLKMFRSPAGLARVMPVFITRNPATGCDSLRVCRWLRTRTGRVAPSSSKPPRDQRREGAKRARGCAQKSGRKLPEEVETTLLPCGGGPGRSSMVSWPKGKSRAASRHSSACGAAGTSTLTSLASWAC